MDARNIENSVSGDSEGWRIAVQKTNRQDARNLHDFFKTIRRSSAKSLALELTATHLVQRML